MFPTTRVPEFVLLDRAPRAAAANQLGLAEPVDGLGHRVIEIVADGSRRRLRAEFLDPVRVDHGKVVRSVIGVMNEPVEVPG
ncbi:hypothetical protein [Microbacterium sp. G2-8]|uniref:hypothetical protein n=1 Tax=Microbacterium sp. G2-8 TaxID=2842454 RepID=UPI001C89079E|nr:hypothetical protein [Microbacterium sp. G2-8]